MYALLPYVWILFMVGLVVATIVAALMNGPKKPSKAKGGPGNAGSSPTAEAAAPALDFGDELTDLDK